MISLKKRLFMLFTISAAATIWAPPADAQRYNVHTYTESDGLPSSKINDIAQDSRGRLWIATRSGIASFDGVEWKYHTPQDGVILYSPEHVLVDPADRVWLITAQQSLRVAVFEDAAWWRMNPPPSMGADVNRTVAAVVPCDTAWAVAVAPDGGGVLYVRAGRWHSVAGAKALDSAVYAIEPTRGGVFLATRRGVWVGSTIDAPFSRVDAVPGKQSRALAFDPTTGDLWVAGDTWVGVLNAAGRFDTRIDFGTPFLSGAFRHLVSVCDPAGRFYVSNPLGFLRIDADGTVERMDASNGLAAASANALFRDREGNVWVGTDRGLSRIDDLALASYTTDQGTAVDEVTAICERDDSVVVFGHPAAITIMEEPPRRIRLPGSDRQSRVLDLTCDTRGRVWAAAFQLGLVRVHRDGRIDVDRPPRGRRVMSIRADTAGGLWICTSNALTRRSAAGRVDTVFTIREVSSAGYLRRIFVGRNGVLYVGTHRGGVVTVRGDRVVPRLTGDRPEQNDVFAVLEDDDGSLWVGTMAGLRHEQGGAFESAAAPVIARPVYFVLRDSDGGRWFGTDNGVYRWDGRVLSHLGVEDGLAGRETNRAAGFQDSGGDVWIGTDRGATVYRERFARADTSRPIVQLISIETPGKESPGDADVTVDYDNNAVQFRFHATIFGDPEPLRYQIQLIGLESEWHDATATPKGSVRYANLGPGEYRFRVRAARSGGPWSAVAESGSIVVHGPFWHRPWVIALASAAALLLVLGAAVLVQQRRHARRLEREVERRVEEKRGIERELSNARKLEALGVLAGGIAHDFNNLLTVVLGNLSLIESEYAADESTRSSARDAIAAVYRAKSLTSQLLTFSRGGAPVRDPGSVKDVIRESARFVLSGSSARCDFDLPDDLWPVEMDADQISQVINNLLLNAQQACESGGELRVRASNVRSPIAELPEGRYVSIEVVDDGVGISSKHLDRIFDPYFTTKDGGSGLGLATSYSIVNRHGGTIRVESKVAEGSVFHVFLPATDRRPAATRAGDKADPGNGGRVLIMDDDVAVRRVLGRLLSRLGYEVAFAANGAEAIDAYTNAMQSGARFDAVLVDLTIRGGMGGKDAIRYLRARDPAIRAIVISGYSNDPILSDFRSHGFCARMGKPISQKELQRVLFEVLADSAIPEL